MRRTLRLLALALPLAVAACLGDDPISPPPDIETINFATALGVDLANSTETASGLWYRDVVTGDGATPTAGDSVRVKYRVNLTNGTLFEEGEFWFRLDRQQVVLGINEGVRGMKVGGRRQLIIPPHLAYGTSEIHSGQTKVTAPPNSVLVFEVTLENVRAPGIE